MPEIIFNGPAGRIEGRYQPSREKNAPLALLLHPHPRFGGNMNNKIIYDLFYMYVDRGFAALRFNFRGVGRSQGAFDHGTGELSDAAAALDWVQTIHPDARGVWITGFSFGAWIGMQLLMRRPEVEGFISIAPPTNLHDFAFLAPCPSDGLIIHGDQDKVVPMKDTQALIDKLGTQKASPLTTRSFQVRTTSLKITLKNWSTIVQTISTFVWALQSVCKCCRLQRQNFHPLKTWTLAMMVMAIKHQALHI